MAEKSEALRQIVEKIRDDAEQALKLLGHSEGRTIPGLEMPTM
jgi:hypothetical protein